MRRQRCPAKSYAYSIRHAIRTHLILPDRLLVLMVLMDDEVAREDLERDAGEVYFKEAGSLVATVADEALVAPDGNRLAVYKHDQHLCGG